MCPEQREDRARHNDARLTERTELDLDRGGVPRPLIQEANAVFPPGFVIQQLALTRPAKLLPIQQEASFHFDIELWKANPKARLF